MARLGFFQKSMESHIFTPLSNHFPLQITEVRSFIHIIILSLIIIIIIPLIETVYLYHRKTAFRIYENEEKEIGSLKDLSKN